MSYQEKINLIRKTLGLSWYELAIKLGTNEANLKNSIRRLGRIDRKRNPLGWDFSILISFELLDIKTEEDYL